jgi:hypothetical protein
MTKTATLKKGKSSHRKAWCTLLDEFGLGLAKAQKERLSKDERLRALVWKLCQEITVDDGDAPALPFTSKARLRDRLKHVLDELALNIIHLQGDEGEVMRRATRYPTKQDARVVKLRSEMAVMLNPTESD